MKKPSVSVKRKIIHHNYNEGGEKNRVEKFFPVRGGVSWPVGPYPGYFIIIGEKYHEDVNYFETPRQRGQLVVFDEQEHTELSIDEFFRKISDAAFYWGCNDFYCEPFDNCREHIYEWGEYMQRHKIDLETPSPAPVAEDYRMGLSFVNRWSEKGLLSLTEDSSAGSQLRTFTAESFDEPIKKFHAINGLRYVIAAFERDPGYLDEIDGIYIPQPYRGPHGWMR